MIDAAFAVLFATAFAWLFHVSVEAAESATTRYGHNVDSGALEFAFASLYLGPMAVLFASASVAIWRGWRFGRALHWVAVLGAVAPIAYAAMGMITHW